MTLQYQLYFSFEKAFFQIKFSSQINIFYVKMCSFIWIHWNLDFDIFGVKAIFSVYHIKKPFCWMLQKTNHTIFFLKFYSFFKILTSEYKKEKSIFNMKFLAQVLHKIIEKICQQKVVNIWTLYFNFLTPFMHILQALVTQSKSNIFSFLIKVLNHIVLVFQPLVQDVVILVFFYLFWQSIKLVFNSEVLL